MSSPTRWLTELSSASRMRRGRRSASSRRGLGGRSARRSARGSRRRPAADGEEERRAAARLALHPHPAAQALGEAPADHQPQAGAAIDAGDRGVGLAERLEQAVDAVGRDADPGVAHGEEELDQAVPLARRRVDLQADLAARRELDGVVEQVDQDLPQAAGVALDRRRHAVRHPAVEREPLAARPSASRIPIASSRQSRRTNGADSISSLPASIFETSRMSLITAEQGLAAAAGRRHVLPLLGGQRRVAAAGSSCPGRR